MEFRLPNTCVLVDPGTTRVLLPVIVWVVRQIVYVAPFMLKTVSGTVSYR
jgi:hypothetical protein